MIFAASPLITLTTDFGAGSGYVGALHGVIATICPCARVIDLCHAIPACDIVHGAYVMGTTCKYFPKDTIHVGVVDPEVGSARRMILIRTRDYFFIGPDNGLFTLALQGEEFVSVHELKNAKYRLREISATFHGRDIFAPTAAYLAKGEHPEQFGPAVKSCVLLPDFSPARTRDRLVSRIVAIDRFGNLITGITRAEFTACVGKRKFELRVGALRLTKLFAAYAEVPSGKPVLLFGSGGFLEIAVNQGHAAERLGLKSGGKVRLTAF